MKTPHWKTGASPRWRAALVVLALPLTMAHAGSSPHYRWDEAKNEPGPHRCTTSHQCDGLRTCSPHGWCQGEARPPPPERPPPSSDRRRGPRERPEPGPNLQQPLRIQSQLRGLVLDVEGNNRDQGASILAHPAKRPEEGNANQVWELVPTHGGFLVRSRLNGLVLDIEGASRSPGTRVMTHPPHGGPNQVWKLMPSESSGAFYIVSALNGFVLDVSGAPKEGTGRVVAHPINTPASDNQLWRLVP